MFYANEHGTMGEKEHSIWKHVPLISFINIILLAFCLSEPEPCIGYMLHVQGDLCGNCCCPKRSVKIKWAYGLCMKNISQSDL